MDTRRTRRRSASVTLGLAAALAATLSGCSAGQEEYAYGAVCADRQTQQRVDDDRCDSDRGGGGGAFGWYYLRAGTLAQPVGGRLGGGSFTAPPSGEAVYRGGVPSGGGIVSRGGFGGSSHSVGG